MLVLVCAADRFKETRGEVSKNMLIEGTKQCTIAPESRDLVQSEA